MNSALSRRAKSRDLPRFEALEPRVLLSGDAPCITLIEADNRGEIVLFASERLNGNTVNAQSIRITLAGDDGLLGTEDDVLASYTVNYDFTTEAIRVNANIAPSQQYAITINGDMIRDQQGNLLDAEFNGDGVPTGNGTAGGTGTIYAGQNQEDGTIRVRYQTVLGNIDLVLFAQDTPLTVANFLEYANAGAWDNTFFHRLAFLNNNDPFVLQGGGFNADADYSMIPQNSPVLNEPGISNTFGTIAMAKVGGNPNSATNQWFFNLGNNSGNLDTQNGGFTVFGEIQGAASFAVLDALIQSAVVNATANGGAFNELPVLDASQVNGVPTPDNLLVVSRVSVLNGLFSEPFQQFSPDASIVFSNSNNTATVRIFDLTGVGQTQIRDAVRVTFTGADNISSITIRDDFAGKIGIVVSDGGFVGRISDLRSSSESQGVLSFIISSAEVRSISLRHGIEGFNLNGAVLPGGLFMESDIDSDGRFDDPVAIFIGGGITNSISIRGDVTGDIVAEGGLKSLTLYNKLEDATIVIGDDAVNPRLPEVTARLNLREVENVAVRSDLRLTTVRATNWINTDGEDRLIQTSEISSIRISGDRRNDLNGDFEVGLNLTGTALPGRYLLGSASIAGDIFDSTWDINGPFRSLSVRGDITRLNLEIDGKLGSFRAGEVLNTNLTVHGESGSIRIAEWTNGSITVDGDYRSLTTTGSTRDGIAGNLSGVITLNGMGDPTERVGSISVRGGIGESTINVFGLVHSFRVRGDSNDADVTFNQGARLVRVEDWNGGALRVGGETSSAVIGAFDGDLAFTDIRRLTVDGDLQGSIVIEFLDRLNINGNMSADATFRTVDTATIRGDILSGTWQFFSNARSGDFSIESLVVYGNVSNLDFYADNNVEYFRADGLVNSNIVVGGNSDIVGFPDNAADIDTEIALERIVILGDEDRGIGFESSSIVAGRMTYALLATFAPFSSGSSVGVATSEIERVDIDIIGDREIQVERPLASVNPIGNIQVRIGFLPVA